MARRFVNIRLNIPDGKSQPEAEADLIRINNVNFQPDEVIVRSVSATLSPAAPDSQMFSVYSDMVEEELFNISIGNTYAANIFPNVSFRPRGGNGPWVFRLTNGRGQEFNIIGVLVLFVQLEFIKHE